MNRTFLPGLTLASAVAVSLPAYAADAGPAPSAEPGKLEEVVVTAQRRQESAQVVGIALSVLTAAELREANIDKVNGLANATPSLEIEPAFGSGQPQFRLRGVGFIDYTSNNSSAVGISVDEVPLPFPIQTQGQLFDLSRVEVLRGPQGSLYGLNSTGGAVNFVIVPPTRAAHAGFDAEYGSYGALVGEGFVSGAVGDDFAGRISVATAHGGAWQWNRLTGAKLGAKDRLAARVQLQWEPTSAAAVRLTVHTAVDRSDTQGNQLIRPFTPSTAGGGGGPVIPADTDPHVVGWSLQPAFAAMIGVAPGSKPGVDNSNNGAEINATFELGTVRLTSITAYDKFVRRELGDWDATQYAESDIYFHDHVETFSEELRLASSGSGPFSWLAGARYADDKLTENFYGDFANLFGFPAATALTAYRQNGQSLGAFAQGSYELSDRLKAVLGLRPDHETRELLGLNTVFAGSSLNGGPANRSLANTSLSGKAELDFMLAPQTLLYGSVSRGVKSGGFTAHNTTSPNPTIIDPFAPEKLLASELGVKAEIAWALRVNASLFHYDYTDQQVLSKYFDSVSKSYIGRFINAPKSRIDGGEVELTWVAGDGFELSQYLGYKDGKYTAAALNSSGADFNGQNLDFPKLSYGGALAYAWPVGAYRLKAATNYSYHDAYDQLFLLENVDASAHVVGAPQFRIDAYWLANVSLALSPAAGSPWTVSIWAHNLTNQKYFLTKNFFIPGNNLGQAGQPATVGLRIDWQL